jgi:4-hydroxybenzoate polyprenyltransferase
MWNSHLIENTNRLLKIDKWWVYKIGSGVFTLILLKLISNPDSNITFFISDLLLFLILILLAVYGHFINDYSDYEIDKIAGKSNIFSSIPIRIAPALILILAIGAISLAVLNFSIDVQLFVGLQLISSVLYSLKPFRIKERGLFALALTGFYERLNPYIIIFLCTIPAYNQLPITVLALILLYLVWSYLWECRNFINGQLKDVENDKQSSVKSLVIFVGQSQTILIKNVLLFIEVAALISWLGLLVTVEFNGIYFLLGVLVFQLIQVNGSRTRYRKIEVVLDNCYSNIFMASLLIILALFGRIDPLLAAGIILFFQYRVIADVVDFIFNRIRHILIFFWKIWHRELNTNKAKNENSIENKNE